MHTGLLLSSDKVTLAGESNYRQAEGREAQDYYFYTRRFSDRNLP